MNSDQSNSGESIDGSTITSHSEADFGLSGGAIVGNATERMSETGKGRVRRIKRGDTSWKSTAGTWRSNHGTQLMAFAGLIILIGFGILYYQENRFRPPSFPSGDLIDSTEAKGDSLDPQGITNRDGTQSDTTDAGITVKIAGATGQEGVVRIAIYHAADNFNDSENADWKQALVIGDDGIAIAKVPVEALADRFCIAVYHDANENGTLDRGAFGIPSERYGYSNAARGKLGPPAFEQALISRPVPDGIVELAIW